MKNTEPRFFVRDPLPKLRYSTECLDAISGAGLAGADAELVEEGSDFSLHLLSKETMRIPGTDTPVSFCIYRTHEYKPEFHDLVYFIYYADDVQVAKFIYTLHPNRVYELHHRYVLPEMRNNGIGLHILQNIENIFQAIANKDGSDVELKVQCGQVSVIQWFLKRDYVFNNPEDKSLWDDFCMHPDNYSVDQINEDPEDEVLQRQDGIFLAGTCTLSRDLKDTVRFNLHKIITHGT